jgi:2-polyprenyl-3-methyl-5-hydroxy-6-metoxy-1,4-benzoquinol methylase
MDGSLNTLQCPQCLRSTSSRPFWSNPRFVKCIHCRLIFRTPFPDSETLATLYKKSWTAPEERKTETGATDLPFARQLLTLLLADLRQDLSGKRVLDFGAGRGAMALALREIGAEVVAVDPFGTDYLNSLGFESYRDLHGLPWDIKFDGIISLEVLEHLIDPKEVLETLHSKLLPGAWLFLTTPNAAGAPARLSGKRWREASKPGHILFFTPKTLRDLLARVGFRKIRRPRWLIRYPDATLQRAAIHFLLQATRQDGGLRLLAYKD